MAPAIDRHVEGYDIDGRQHEEADFDPEQLVPVRVNRTSGESMGKITLSVGVSRFRPDEGADSFIARADEARKSVTVLLSGQALLDELDTIFRTSLVMNF